MAPSENESSRPSKMNSSSEETFHSLQVNGTVAKSVRSKKTTKAGTKQNEDETGSLSSFNRNNFKFDGLTNRQYGGAMSSYTGFRQTKMTYEDFKRKKMKNNDTVSIS